MNYFHSSDFLPHGHCFFWLPKILWVHVVSDALIALAYFMIPVALFYLIRNRKDLPYKWLFFAFSAFILLCGCTHLFSIWVLWYPDYPIEGLLKAATAVVSLATLVILCRVVPQMLSYVPIWSGSNNQENFQLLANTLPQLVWMADASGSMYWYNQQWYDFTGTTKEQMIGWGWTSLHDPEQLPLVMEKWQASIKIGKPFEMVFPLKGADGVFHHFLTRINPIYDQNKQLINWFGTNTDISSQHMQHTKTIAALNKEESERTKLLALIESSPNFIGMADMDGALQYHNLAAKNLVGLPEDTIMQNLKISDMHPQWAAKIINEQAIPYVLKHGVWRGETALLHRDGHEIPVLQVLTVYKDLAGIPTNLTTIMQDITDYKKSEEALKVSEETFRLAMQHAPIGKALVSPEGKFLMVNKALYDLVGYEEKELLNLDFQTITHIDDLQSDLNYVRKMLEGKISSYTMEKRYIHKQGNIVWVLLNVSLAKHANGSPYYFICQIQDITQRRESEKKLKSYTIAIERSNKELEEFAYVASHDLKAPLRVIDNISKWLEKDLAEYLNNDTRENMTMLRGRVKRMEKLLDDLLEYSRAGLATDERFSEVINGNLLIADVLQLLPSEKFTVSISPNFATVTLNRMPLQQILLNLIGNAIKHHNKETGTIQINVEHHDDYYTFSVKDDGPGIPFEFHEEIYHMFSTLKPRDEVEGSGMGLALVKKNVEIFGGSLSLISKPGEGSEFVFTWPKIQKTIGSNL